MCVGNLFFVVIFGVEVGDDVDDEMFWVEAFGSIAI